MPFTTTFYGGSEYPPDRRQKLQVRKGAISAFHSFCDTSRSIPRIPCTLRLILQ